MKIGQLFEMPERKRFAHNQEKQNGRAQRQRHKSRKSRPPAAANGEGATIGRFGKVQQSSAGEKHRVGRLVRVKDGESLWRFVAPGERSAGCSAAGGAGGSVAACCAAGASAAAAARPASSP